jgi:tetratricopeptide (TPR) repeat protein
MSHEYILGLTHLLLFLFSIVTIVALILGRLIVNFPGLFLKLLEGIFEIIFTSVAFLIVKMLRLIALQYLFSFLFKQLEERCFSNKPNPITYGSAVVVLFCIFFLVISPGELFAEEIAMMVAFLLLLIDKISAIKRTKSFLSEAKLFEKAAKKAYEQGQLYDTLAHYGKALDIYKMPLIVQNTRWDVDRAKLLEKMAIVLYNDNQLEKALMRLHQALDIYKKPHIAKERTLKRYHVRVLRESASILRELGRRNEALKRYELISELTGNSVAVPKDFFAWQ